MQTTEHIAQLERDGARLADAARDLGAAVPPCPQWTVRDLVTHIGGVHRWAAGIVRDHDPAPGEGDLATPGSDDPVEWFRAGHAELVRTLRAADPQLQCYTFLPSPAPLAFWARRQAHETAIHRADAESALIAEVPGPTGPVTRFPTAFAADGIDEMLAGFAARRRSFRHVDGPRTLAIRPGDAEGWSVTLAPDGIRVSRGDEPGEATVSGSASDLYLWLWNRPADVVVDGDQQVADLWRRIRVRW